MREKERHCKGSNWQSRKSNEVRGWPRGFVLQGMIAQLVLGRETI